MKIIIIFFFFQNRWVHPFVLESDFTGTLGFRYENVNKYFGKNVELMITSNIGNNVVIGADTRIGDNSKIDTSSVGKNVRIGKNVSISNSYIWDNVKIEGFEFFFNFSKLF